MCWGIEGCVHWRVEGDVCAGGVEGYVCTGGVEGDVFTEGVEGDVCAGVLRGMCAY